MGRKRTLSDIVGPSVRTTEDHGEKGHSQRQDMRTHTELLTFWATQMRKREPSCSLYIEHGNPAVPGYHVHIVTNAAFSEDPSLNHGAEEPSEQQQHCQGDRSCLDTGCGWK